MADRRLLLYAPHAAHLYFRSQIESTIRWQWHTGFATTRADASWWNEGAFISAAKAEIAEAWLHHDMRHDGRAIAVALCWLIAIATALPVCG